MVPYFWVSAGFRTWSNFSISGLDSVALGVGVGNSRAFELQLANKPEQTGLI